MIGEIENFKKIPNLEEVKLTDEQYEEVEKIFLCGINNFLFKNGKITEDQRNYFINNVDSQYRNNKDIIKRQNSA